MNRSIGIALGLATVVCTARAGRADVKLPAIFGDHMVLQKGRPIPFWGVGGPKEKVTIEIAGRRAQGVADAQGRWRINVPALPAGGPHEVVVTGNNRVPLVDVLVGEVWIASGQSNMEMQLKAAGGGEAALQAAQDPGLRLFQVGHGTQLAAYGGDVDGHWAVASPPVAREFSAIGYFFGQTIRDAVKEPVGIVETAWGGTAAESWTRLEILKQRMPELLPRVYATPEEHERVLREFRQGRAAWEKENTHREPPNTGEAQGFARPNLSDSDWLEMPALSPWEDHGIDGDGVVWFRKWVDVPVGWAGKDLDLSLGTINDCDTTYVNGIRVGETCHHTPDRFGGARLYKVPGKLVHAGKVLVAIRVFDERGRGGFSSATGPLWLQRAGSDAVDSRVPLTGAWKYKIEKLLPTMQARWDLRSSSLTADYPDQHTPGGIWETMVRPLVPFGMRGVIWYQGEANAPRAVQYRTLFPLMITDWRKAWGQGNFPFYFVQLPGYFQERDEREWPELREAQTMATKLPNTGMAIAIEVGDPNDAHPLNKKEVARRLSLWALDRVYGKKQEVSGPLFVSAAREKDGIRIRFSHAGKLKVRAGETALRGFTIAGEDGNFVSATVRIDGTTVVVSAPEVANPVAVRYGWGQAPPCNLENGEGLPASPFRTDHFVEFTRDRK